MQMKNVDQIEERNSSSNLITTDLKSCCSLNGCTAAVKIEGLRNRPKRFIVRENVSGLVVVVRGVVV